MLRRRAAERAERDPWQLANEYLAWFAIECHFTPDQVYDMPFSALIALTLSLDDLAEARKKQQQQSQSQPEFRPMC